MDICQASYAYKDVIHQPVEYALNEDSPDDLSISIESDLSVNANVPSYCLETDDDYSYSDFLDGLFDDYDIHPTILGTGNDACVRECLHRSTGQKYAVKTIEKSKDSTGDDHIQREIQLLRSIDHPGIVKLVDYYEDGANIYIVTEKYTGGELFEKIIDNTTDHGCLPECQAAKLVKSLLEAVQYLHSKDIVHRDIKPENILFETNMEGAPIKLIDFGLSSRHGLTDIAMTEKVGTPYYMSPGVLQGNYDRTCDLWAIGVISYVLLCGYPPFDGSTDDEVFDAIRRGNLVFEKDIWGNLSKTSRDFVSKLICMDSSKIGTAAEALKHQWIVIV